jgi:hypothetical protein
MDKGSPSPSIRSPIPAKAPAKPEANCNTGIWTGNTRVSRSPKGQSERAREKEAGKPGTCRPRCFAGMQAETLMEHVDLLQPETHAGFLTENVRTLSITQTERMNRHGMVKIPASAAIATGNNYSCEARPVHYSVSTKITVPGMVFKSTWAGTQRNRPPRPWELAWRRFDVALRLCVRASCVCGALIAKTWRVDTGISFPLAASAARASVERRVIFPAKVHEPAQTCCGL